MISTLGGYRLYSTDMAKSLERVEASGSVAREAKYYEDNIGNVTSVDDFLDDYRLYSYAMKAYGLEDQLSSKGFIRKVIESDLSDQTSFANALTDSRYRKFASAFNFDAVAVTDTRPVQSTGQTDRLVEAYSENRILSAVSSAAKTNYYQQTIGQVRTVDELLANKGLKEVLLRSVGADPATTSLDYIKKVLTGAINDDPLSQTDDRFFRLAGSFNFGADGTVVGSGPAQDAAETEFLIHEYYRNTGNVSSQRAAHETAYASARIDAATNADDVVNDDRVFSYMRAAYSLESSNKSKAQTALILESDLSDPASVVNLLPSDTAAGRLEKERYIALVKVFNFQGGGTVAAGSAQTAEARSALADAYHDRYEEAATSRDDAATTRFRLKLKDMESLTDLLASEPGFGRKSLEYVLKAFDLDPAMESLSKIRRVLQSDASDPNSYVNTLKDERYEKLAAAFNFNADGTARLERAVQSPAKQSETGKLYAATYGTETTAVQKALIRTETRSYLQGVGALRTLDDLLKDTKVLNYALKAYGLDEKDLSTDAIGKILTSDLGDKTSYVYSLGDEAYASFAKAFNFKPDGRVGQGEAGVQGAAARLATQNLYLLQTLEEQAGDTNEGTRLALYFLRKGPEINSTLSLLADKALTEVVTTALGLPSGFSQLDIDKQVKIIEKRLDVKDFDDPTKLDRFISRFAALYDIESGSGGSNAPLLALFGGSSSGRGGGILGVL